MSLPLTGAGPPGGGFSPASIAGLVGWWKADALASVADGTAVASLPDSSGNGKDMTQATGTKQPLYRPAKRNGLACLEFDATDDGYASTCNPGTNITALLVYAPSATENASRRMVQGIVGNWLMGPYNATINCYAGNFGPAGPATAAGVFHQQTLTQSGTGGAANAAHFVDGVALGTFGATIAPGSMAMGASGSTAEVAKSFFAEAIIYNAVLSGTDRQAVEAYLKTKWATP